MAKRKADPSTKVDPKIITEECEAWLLATPEVYNHGPLLTSATGSDGDTQRVSREEATTSEGTATRTATWTATPQATLVG